MRIALQLLTSLVTIYSVWLAGNGDQRFNWVGLGNQVLWLLVIIQTGTYGLLLTAAAMTFVYTRNIIHNRKVLLDLK
jgi:hypothetical protein